MHFSYRKNSLIINKLTEIANEFLLLFKNKYFYIGAISLIIGIELNYYSQEYLLNYIQNGSSLPVLSDLILDNIPLWDVDIYMIFFH